MAEYKPGSFTTLEIYSWRKKKTYWVEFTTRNKLLPDVGAFLRGEQMRGVNVLEEFDGLPERFQRGQLRYTVLQKRPATQAEIHNMWWGPYYPLEPRR